MEQICENLNEMRTEMGTNMGQCMEAIQTLALRQEELRQVLQRPAPDGNPTPGEGLVNQNVRNVVEIPIPAQENAHHENNLEPEAFRFPINETEKRFHLLEKRLKAIEGRDSIDLDADGLCLVPGVKIPVKFRVPNFEKYKGITCPLTHVKAFCNKMAPYAENDKLLMHFFQDSLSGTSLEWYTQLERTHVRTWKELAEAFVKRYKHNSDMAPTRIQLQALTQRTDESFREYARRWRELAARVQPPLLEQELMGMFKDMLEGPYYQGLIGASKFAELVVIGERIENGLRNGNIQDVDDLFEFPRRVEGRASVIPEYEEESLNHPLNQISRNEMEAIISIQDGPQICATALSHPPTQFAQRDPVLHDQSAQYAPPWRNHQQNRHQQGRQRRRKPKRVYDAIPMTHDELLSELLKLSLVETKQLDPVSFPYPEGFDPDVSCGYHAGAPGHSTEDCQPFKDKVQDLIDAKAIAFTPEGQN
ncbi:uncharacterized protein LOC131619443 [Vicia villosa]|uniref:uncharacterized protein LOC131619443 n=1 Tax=Vicia villosa TaxID=3911 RepID=UPI00273C7BF5|nr:uncharacterized protein LOC131619443 [Vicia villosa]